MAPTTLRRIGLLFWKNLTLRKRHWIITTCEILLPALFAVLVAIGRATSGNGQSYSPPPPTQPPPDPINTTPQTFEYGRDELRLPGGQTLYRPIPEHELLTRLSSNAIGYRNSTSVVLYAPDNEETKKILAHVKTAYDEFLQSVNRTCTLENELYCVNWRGVKNEVEIERSALEFFQIRKKLESNTTFPNGILVAGIVFTSDLTKSTDKIEYKLRMPTTFRTEMKTWAFTTGPGYVLPGYSTFNGFQILIDRGIIKWKTGNALDVKLSIQQMPYPAHDTTINFLYVVLPHIVALGFIFAVPSLLRIISNEKITGIHELLKLMGLPKWMHWLGYMINSLIILLISITIVIAFFFIPFSANQGGIIENSDPSLWWIVLFLYVISLTSSTFFVSTLFNRPALAITFGILFYIIPYYGLFFPLTSASALKVGAKLALCLFPNNGMHVALSLLTAMETDGGAQWRRIGEHIALDRGGALAVYQVMLVQLASILLFLALTFYLENVIPSPFGLRKPWYYIFLPQEWGFKNSRSVMDSTFTHHSNVESDAFEQEPEGAHVGIDIRDLQKQFGKNVAVDSLNLKMYEGEITALLGQNGAGKTTTMSMLTGMFSPTSGTAYINGYNITTEMSKVRENLGLCPQENMLFNRLTVKEHLIFFGRLKGLTVKEAKKEARNLIERLRLEDKKNSLSMSLSGGQKRKLSLGCALISGSKIVMLDEPTSGMDVENRRIIWDLLLEFREGRTIVLTTHFMEEADVLGDRIAIMDNGKLVCAGTPMFLKHYYGTGYLLKLTTRSSESHDQILEFVRSYVSGANWDKYSVRNNDGLGIRIPSTDTSTFPILFGNLSKYKKDWGIMNIGLTQTTMDDVFVRVGELTQQRREISHTNEAEEKNNNQEEGETTSKISGGGLIIQQLLTLLKKKMVFTYRRTGVMAVQVFLPILVLVLLILVTNSLFIMGASEPPLTISLSSYDSPITPYATSDKVLGESYAKAAGSSAVSVATNDMDNYLLEIGEKDINYYLDHYIVGAIMNTSLLNAVHQNTYVHSSALAMSLATNTLFKSASSGTRDAPKIEVTNHPFSDDVQNALHSSIDGSLMPILFAILFPIALGLLMATFIILPIEEKKCSGKHLQLMTGVNPITYWASYFLWDFLVILVLGIVMIICLFIFQTHNTYTSYGGGGIFLAIFLLFGFQTIPISYLLSLRAESVPGGFSIVTILHLLSGGAMYFLILVAGFFLFRQDYNQYGVDELQTNHGRVALTWIGRLFPSYSLTSAMSTYAATSIHNVRCNIFPEEYRELICVPEENEFYGFSNTFKECCEQCGQKGFPPCFKPREYLKWTTAAGGLLEMSGLAVPGILQDLFGMFLIGLFYHALLITIELGLWRKLVQRGVRAAGFIFVRRTKDEDVLQENSRVKKLITAGKFTDDALVVHNLSKNFGSFSAVSKISFGVHEGECFGLLGVNGAGKTTTFRMLTGEDVPAMGTAQAHNFSLANSRKDFLRNMGYCPQFDGLIGVLTGNQMLELFAGLRGIPRGSINGEVKKWMEKMGLSGSGNVLCSKYSGGMKRRLSSAMAMIGDPTIVLLDEPTTGVDPVARREFWKTITSLRKAGQSIVLTSHSMEECEQLCTRLAIMVNGEFQCFGAVQHLKDKFARGFSLTIQIKQKADGTPITSEQMDVVKTEICNSFAPCVLRDSHHNTIEFHISNPTLEWSYLFEKMEAFRLYFSDILEDYAINQTTLEEVFLAFARQQYPERKAEHTSCFRKFCKACCCCC